MNTRIVIFLAILAITLTFVNSQTEETTLASSADTENPVEVVSNSTNGTENSSSKIEAEDEPDDGLFECYVCGDRIKDVPCLGTNRSFWKTEKACLQCKSVHEVIRESAKTFDDRYCVKTGAEKQKDLCTSNTTIVNGSLTKITESICYCSSKLCNGSSSFSSSLVSVFVILLTVIGMTANVKIF